MTLDQLKQLNPVDFAVLNLEPFAINILGIGKMEVGSKRKNIVEKVAERAAEMIASKFGMGCIQANPHLLFPAEVGNEVAVNKQIVKALPAKMPREWRHRLGNDLNFTIGVQLFQAFDQTFTKRHAFASIEMTMF